jgi:hypothetical protein
MTRRRRSCGRLAVVLGLAVLLSCPAVLCGGGRAAADPPTVSVPSAGLAPGAGVPGPTAPETTPTVPSPSPGTSPDPHYTPAAPKPRPSPPPDGGLAPPATPDSGGGVSIFDIPGQIKAAFASLLASLLAPMAVPLMDLLAHFLLATPDVTALPRVAGLWEAMRVLACSLYGLFVLAAGILAMGHGTVQQRFAVRDLVPRLALGMFAANLSLFFCEQAIALTNALSAAVFGDAITANDLAGTLVGLLTNMNPVTAPLYLMVFVGVVQVLGWMLVVTLLVRTAVVTVLVVAAPLLLACHASPATEGAARLSWRAFCGVMAAQAVQSVVFLVCVKVVLDPSNYSMLGMPGSVGLINLMLLCCTLYVLLKIPGVISRLVTQPVQRQLGGGGGGMRLLRKVALGAIGMPLGPYGLGAQLAARAGMRGGAAKFLAGGFGRGGGRRPPGSGGPTAPGGQRPGTGPGPGGGTPRYTWGTPTGPRTPPGQGGQGPGPTPGTPPPPISPGPGPGPGTGPRPGPGPRPHTGGPGQGLQPQYAWGAGRRRGAGNHVPGAGPARPQLPPGPTGSGVASEGRPTPGTGGPRPTGPRPAPGGGVAPGLRPARVPLPPPLPRPMQLHLPLQGLPPQRRPRRGRKNDGASRP